MVAVAQVPPQMPIPHPRGCQLAVSKVLPIPLIPPNPLELSRTAVLSLASLANSAEPAALNLREEF